MEFGIYVRQARIDRNLGLREAARKIRVSSSYLSHIEKDQSPPSEEVIRRLAELLNVDFDKLMQLADRVPEDIREIVTSDSHMPAFLRAAKERGVTGLDLLRLLEMH